MSRRIASICACWALWLAPSFAQNATLHFPGIVEAGTAVSLPTTGSGSATCYVVGPGGAIRRAIPLGTSLSFSAEELQNAGSYAVFLVTSSGTQTAQFNVVSSARTASISFLAKPSRVPVNLSDGLSGVAYLFDLFRNLVLQPEQVTFDLADSNGRNQAHTATTRNGVAWVRVNSAGKAGAGQFQAMSGNAREKRVIQQVAGDACSLRMHASANGKRVVLETDPVRDCSGNPVPDGTVVSFTLSYPGGQSTVEVPLKRGVARTEMAARSGAVISVASGVVMGNEIRWSGGS